MEKLCIQCGNKVKSYSKKAKYCSKKCYSDFRKIDIKINHINKLQRRKELRRKNSEAYPSRKIKYYTCKQCNLLFILQATSLFSKNNCRNKACIEKAKEIKAKKTGLKQQHKIFKKCINCKKEFRVSKSLIKRKFCSHHCSSSGEFNNNYKGGIQSKNSKIRNSSEYKQWRTNVFERDNYTCKWCGQVGGVLHVDHIKPFAFYPELRFDLNNGRVLCICCHKKTDTYLKGNKKF